MASGVTKWNSGEMARGVDKWMFCRLSGTEGDEIGDNSAGSEHCVIRAETIRTKHARLRRGSNILDPSWVSNLDRLGNRFLHVMTRYSITSMRGIAWGNGIMDRAGMVLK
jgi:hypothetical protein